MLQIAYFSTASVPQSADVLHDILSVARARNARDGISGVLVAGGNRYMQVIEGPRARMNALWSAIRADQRHCAVTQLLRQRVSRPSFDKWSMAFCGDEQVGRFASFPETLEYLTRYVDDDPLRRQIESFARPFTAPGADLTPAVWDLAF